MNYNIVPLSISNGLDNKKIAGSFDYIILLKAPTNANVRVRLNENTASEIPLNNNFAISAKDVTEILISADAVENEAILIGQSDRIENFQILTAPVVEQIETVNKVNEVSKVNEFSTELLTVLDKIQNPYDTNNIVIVSGNAANTSTATIYQEILDCDKIIVSLIGALTYSGNGAHKAGVIMLYIDGAMVAMDGGWNGSGGLANINGTEYTFENMRGKQLAIKNIVTSSRVSYYAIQKINLKV